VSHDSVVFVEVEERKKEKRKARPFVSCPYVKREGRWEPVLQPVCRMLDCPEGEGCQVKVDHWRKRRTGPGFALLVLECRTHGGYFTVYPPGYEPYGRKEVAPVTPSGSAIEGESLEDSWRRTILRGGHRQRAGPPVAGGAGRG